MVTFIKWSVLVVVVVICILDLLSNNSYKNRKKTKQLTAGQKPNTIAIWLYDMQKIVITVLFAASCIICLAFCPVRWMGETIRELCCDLVPGKPRPIFCIKRVHRGFIAMSLSLSSLSQTIKQWKRYTIGAEWLTSGFILLCYRLLPKWSPKKKCKKEKNKRQVTSTSLFFQKSILSSCQQ